MDPFKLEKVKPYYEQIYQTLKELIFNGDYPPGFRINEVKIAKEFNVSRSPVREAIRALEKEGLLVTNDKSQLEVYNPTLKDVEEIYQCRSALESLSVEIATGLAKQQDIDVLEDLLRKTKSALDGEGKKQELIQLNEQFHDQILELSKNSRLQKLLDDIKSLTHLYRVMNFDGQERKFVIYKEHYQIFLHIKEGNADKAAALMKEHIEHDMLHLKALLQDHPFQKEQGEL